MKFKREGSLEVYHENGVHVGEIKRNITFGELRFVPTGRCSLDSEDMHDISKRMGYNIFTKISYLIVRTVRSI